MGENLLQKARMKEQSFVWYTYKGSSTDGLWTAMLNEDVESFCTSLKEAMAPHCCFLEVEKDSSALARVYISVKFIEEPRTKKAKDKARTQKPKAVVLIFLKDKDVFFCQNTQLKPILSEALKEALGVDCIERVPLDGRDVDSLVKLCAWKGKKRVPVQRLNNSLAEVQTSRKRKCEAMEGQHELKNMNKARQLKNLELFEKVLPPESDIKLNRFVITAREANPDAPNGISTLKLTIRSDNLLNSLATLAEDGAIQSPVPKYLETLLTSGKNHVEIGVSST